MTTINPTTSQFPEYTDMHFRRHRRFDYEQLPDIDALPSLTECQSECITELGECIVSFGAQEIFGVALLHKHFQVRDSEILVERQSEQHTVTQPLPFKDFDIQKLVPTVYGFDSTKDGVDCIELEYAQSENLPLQIFPEIDELFLTAFRILKKHKNLDLFGVARNTENEMNAGDVFLESCDPENRILTSRIHRRHEERPFRTRETRWFWRSSVSANRSCESLPMQVRECQQECRLVGGYGPNGAVWQHQTNHRQSYSTKYEHRSVYK